MAKCKCKVVSYSRVTGYYRPVENWNRGKQEEFKDRKEYDSNSCCKCSCSNDKKELKNG